MEMFAANIFRGWEAVGGVLCLDEEKLYFNPHKLNISKEVEEICVRDIKEVKIENTWLFIRNGLYIETKTGCRHHFVVYHPDKVVSAIKKLLA